MLTELAMVVFILAWLTAGLSAVQYIKEGWLRKFGSLDWYPRHLHYASVLCGPIAFTFLVMFRNI